MCLTPRYPAQIEKFLDQKPADKPFFMWANFSDPHHVWNAPAKFRPDPASLKLPAHWPDLPGMREQLADYCAEVNRLDQSIAAVLAVLEKRQLLDTTLIVFTGDNGAALPHGKDRCTIPVRMFRWSCAGQAKSQPIRSRANC